MEFLRAAGLSFEREVSLSCIMEKKDEIADEAKRLMPWLPAKLRKRAARVLENPEPRRIMTLLRSAATRVSNAVLTRQRCTTTPTGQKMDYVYRLAAQI